uniref:TonB C-terminal domain-containing protein n=1 Tax=mine drainage metagenome TaxID=410659 RepID=E6PZI7_9ZZZZ
MTNPLVRADRNLPGRAAVGALKIAIAALFLASTLSLHAEDRAVKQRVAPIYPEIAKRMRVTGVVQVEATVAPDGKVTATKTLSGNHMLATAAEEAVQRWRFVPGDAQSTVNVEINFALSQ